MPSAVLPKVFGRAVVLLAAATLLTATPPALAAGTSKWQRGPDLLHPRRDATATTLLDGRVLVAGGRDDTSVCVLLSPCNTLGSVEILDRHTGLWSTAATMRQPRTEHTAVRLNDGRVLVAAGRDDNGCGGHCEVNSVEIYDPLTDSWSPTGAFANSGGTATVLADGRVLLAGGEVTRGITTNEASIYDPRTNTWSRVANMLVSRTGHSAALLPDGRVLVVAGRGNCCAVHVSEVYDPVTDTWSEVAPLPEQSSGAVGTVLADGRLLAAGGPAGVSFLYDPATDAWSRTGDMVSGRSGHHATLLPDGRVLVSGGGLAETELFDPSTRSWSRGPKMKVSRTASAAAALPSGVVLEMGGSASTDSQVLDSVEIYR